MSGYFEIAEYQGNVYTRYVREGDTTVYLDSVLETVDVEDFSSYEDAEREAICLADILQEKI